MAGAQSRAHQGQSLRHPAGAGRQPAGRHRPVGPHRRGAGRRPGLEHRSVQAGRKGRPAVRPRQLRHEGFHCRLAGAGAGIPGHAAQEADPPGVLLRRGSRLRRRPVHAGRPARTGHPPRGLRGGRTHRHAGGGGAQGHQPVPLQGARQGGALVADPARLQRHRIRRPPDLPHPRPGRQFQGQRPVRPVLRRAVLDHDDQPDPGRHRGQHHPRAVRIHL